MKLCRFGIKFCISVEISLSLQHLGSKRKFKGQTFVHSRFWSQAKNGEKKKLNQMMKKSRCLFLMKHGECVRASGYRLVSPKAKKGSHLCLANFFFFFSPLLRLSHRAPNLRGTRGRAEAAHWSECVAEDQREACINPMCQSGKNQAQLGSRTVELVGEEEEGEE